MRLLSCIRSALAALIVAALATAIPAQGALAASHGEASSTETSGTPALTAEDAEAFFDGVVPYALERNDIAGCVLVLVKGGKILLAKGYGYANVGRRQPVRADATLFRVASISKLFTWTAVMQLVQTGRLSLDANINDYLDFKLPERFGEPITMRELMTHTAGFEDVAAGHDVKTPAELVIRNYLTAHMPRTIFPPGMVVAYSNYGATIAGYAVQRISGERYQDYIRRHVLEPLGMLHSSFEQPLPATLAANLAPGYRRASAGRALPYELDAVIPAGALSATGTDMAHFMIAQLKGGSYLGKSVLAPATVALMHTPQRRMAASINTFDLGFYEENRNGLQIIGHAGDLPGYHSDLHLLLDQDVGLFVAFNSDGLRGDASHVRVALFREFLDRYYPYMPAVEPTVAAPMRDAARVAGWYIPSRRGVSALRLLSAFRESRITARPDGTIQTDALKDFAGNPVRWREVGPLVYRHVRGQSHLRFVTDKQGRIRYWVTDYMIPIWVNQRVRGIGQLSVLKKLGASCALVWALTLATWGAGTAIRFHYGKTLELTRPAARLRTASRVGAMILLGMLLAWLHYGPHVSEALLSALYVWGVLGAVASVVIFLACAVRVVRGPGKWLVRTGEGVLACSSVYALWVILAYGLASFNFHY